jgi:hypothetical protein
MRLGRRGLSLHLGGSGEFKLLPGRLELLELRMETY